MLPSLPENNQWHRARQPKYRGVTLYWDVADTDSGAGDQKKAIKRGSPILTGAHDSETTEKAHDAFPSLPRFFLFDQLDRIADQIRRQRALVVVSLLLHHGRFAPPDSMSQAERILGIVSGLRALCPIRPVVRCQFRSGDGYRKFCLRRRQIACHVGRKISIRGAMSRHCLKREDIRPLPLARRGFLNAGTLGLGSGERFDGSASVLCISRSGAVGRAVQSGGGELAGFLQEHLRVM